jgi:hypothetical protein
MNFTVQRTRYKIRGSIRIGNKEVIHILLNKRNDQKNLNVPVIITSVAEEVLIRLLWTVLFVMIALSTYKKIQSWMLLHSDGKALLISSPLRVSFS